MNSSINCLRMRKKKRNKSTRYPRIRFCLFRKNTDNITSMGLYIQILGMVIVGIVLLWLGYTIFISPVSPFFSLWYSLGFNKKREKVRGEPGEPQVCPVCSMRMTRGELVKSIAFPSLTGGRDRLMYIKGCFICLQENVPRRCPVCGSSLSLEDFLVSRMFERQGRNNHVHVLGCNRCRRT